MPPDPEARCPICHNFIGLSTAYSIRCYRPNRTIYWEDHYHARCLDLIATKVKPHVPSNREAQREDTPGILGPCADADAEAQRKEP